MTAELTFAVVTWSAILILGLALTGVIRQIRVLTAATLDSRSREHFLVGRVFPEKLLAPNGATRGVLLLLADRECDACRARLSDLSELSRTKTIEESIDVRVLFRDGSDSYAAPGVIVEEDQGDVFAYVGTTTTPYGVVLDGDRIVRTVGPIGSRSHLTRFVEEVQRL